MMDSRFVGTVRGGNEAASPWRASLHFGEPSVGSDYQKIILIETTNSYVQKNNRDLPSVAMEIGDRASSPQAPAMKNRPKAVVVQQANSAA